MRKVVLVFATAVALSSAVPVASAEIVPLASFHSCGDLTSVNSYDLKAKRVGCGKARSVVSTYMHAVQEGGGLNREVSGFRCKPTGYYGDGAYYRCGNRGHRVIKWVAGG